MRLDIHNVKWKRSYRKDCDDDDGISRALRKTTRMCAIYYCYRVQDIPHTYTVLTTEQRPRALPHHLHSHPLPFLPATHGAWRDVRPVQLQGAPPWSSPAVTSPEASEDMQTDSDQARQLPATATATATATPNLRTDAAAAPAGPAKNPTASRASREKAAARTRARTP